MSMAKKSDDEEIKIDRIPHDAMLAHIIDFITQKYEPVDNLADADISISLREIHQHVHAFYSIPFFTETDIMEALLKAGFMYDTFGSLNFYWKMRVRS